MTARENLNFNIPLSQPDITDQEIDSIVEVLRTPYLSLGPKLSEFERKFSKYMSVRHAVAVSSGTAGLHLAITSLNIGANDAVITTPFSFVSSANCMLFERATPIFVDIEHKTFNIDPDKIAEYLKYNCVIDDNTGKVIDLNTDKCIKAILPVHVFGHPCEMDKIISLAKQYNLFVIEDACEAIGAEFDGKKVGTFGDLGIFAFYPNKQMTTGEGGMVITNDERIADLCRSLRNQGRHGNGGWLAHSRLGYNYRLSDIHCALGIAQLNRIDEILEKRANIAYRYNEQLEHYVNIPDTKPRVKKSWFVYVVCLAERFAQRDRAKILRDLSDKKIGCNNYFPPIHLQPFYREMYGYKNGDFPVAEKISERTIALPFHNNLQQEEIDYIVNTLKDLLRKYDHKHVRRIEEDLVRSYDNSLSF